MAQDKLKIGVVGVGHLGEHHVKHLKTIKKSSLMGIFDLNPKRASLISRKHGVHNFESKLTLIKNHLTLVTM